MKHLINAHHVDKVDPNQHSITGRDDLIIAQALHRYIETEAAKPYRDQAWSDLQDARELLDVLLPDADLVWGDDRSR